VHYFFVKKDFDDLNQEIAATCDRIKDAGKEMGLSCQEGAETFHDNFAYEQGQRDQEMWSDRLRQLVRVRNNVRVIVPGPNHGQVRIGRLITVRDLSSGKEKVFRVGSYMIFKGKEVDDILTLSYDAPLPKALIGAKEGEKREAFFGGKRHHFEVVKID
jgi:transcription elongation GreA/GreB family factor